MHSVEAEQAQTALSDRLPLGRRTLQGGSQWYLAQVPDGLERSACEYLRQGIDQALLENAFVLYRERWFKRAGQWFLDPIRLYRGYIIVVTSEPQALAHKLDKLPTSVQMVGAAFDRYLPLASDAQEWFESVLDDSGILRNSEGIIADGQLHVLEGPLRGMEDCVLRIDRHRRCCTVRISDSENGTIRHVPLTVPFKGTREEALEQGFALSF